MAGLQYSLFKRCTKCKEEKWPDQYHADKNRRDGLFPWCSLCVKASQQENYRNKKQKYVEANKLNYQKNKEAYKRRAKEWVEKNPEKRKQVAKKWQDANPVKRYHIQRNNRLSNPGYYAAHFKARQQRKRQAMPTWASVENIRAIYRQCAWVSKVTGVKHHVDHYYPLKSDIVCGLHNEFNLRIVTAFDNLSKGNSFPTEE